MRFYFFSICILIGLSHVTAQFLNGYTNPMYNNPFAPFYDDPYAYNGGYGYNNMMNPYMSYGANGMYMNPYFAYGLGNNMMGGMNGGMGGMNGGMGGMNGGMGGMNGGMGGMNGGMGGMNGGIGFSNYGSAGMGNRLGQRYSGANRLGSNLSNNAHLSHVSCRYGACTRSNNRAEK